jgi:hypothetical protein
MLTFLESRLSRFCDGIARRDFLTIGGLAFGGLALPDVLRAERQRQGCRPGHKGVILIYMPGGPPHQALYDLTRQCPKSEPRP